MCRLQLAGPTTHTTNNFPCACMPSVFFACSWRSSASATSSTSPTPEISTGWVHWFDMVNMYSLSLRLVDTGHVVCSIIRHAAYPPRHVSQFLSPLMPTLNLPPTPCISFHIPAHIPHSTQLSTSTNSFPPSPTLTSVPALISRADAAPAAPCTSPTFTRRLRLMMCAFCNCCGLWLACHV